VAFYYAPSLKNAKAGIHPVPAHAQSQKGPLFWRIASFIFAICGKNRYNTNLQKCAHIPPQNRAKSAKNLASPIHILTGLRHPTAPPLPAAHEAFNDTRTIGTMFKGDRL
jgi:hypothetical protein